MTAAPPWLRLLVLDAVDLEVVRRDALPVGRNRHLVLGLKDRGAGAARPRRVREVDRAAARAARALTEDARRQARQLVGVAPELRQPQDLLRRDRAVDVGVLGLDRRERLGRDRHRLGDFARRERDVEALGLLGLDLDVEDALLEVGLFGAQGVLPRRQIRETVKAVVAGRDLLRAPGLLAGERDGRVRDDGARRVRHRALHARPELGAGGGGETDDGERAQDDAGHCVQLPAHGRSLRGGRSEVVGPRRVRRQRVRCARGAEETRAALGFENAARGEISPGSGRRGSGPESLLHLS